MSRSKRKKEKLPPVPRQIKTKRIYDKMFVRAEKINSFYIFIGSFRQTQTENHENGEFQMATLKPLILLFIVFVRFFFFWIFYIFSYVCNICAWKYSLGLVLSILKMFILQNSVIDSLKLATNSATKYQQKLFPFIGWIESIRCVLL